MPKHYTVIDLIESSSYALVAQSVLGSIESASYAEFALTASYSMNGGSGESGTSGTSGTSGATGTSGTSGTSGVDGTSGTSGTSGITPTGSYGEMYISASTTSLTITSDNVWYDIDTFQVGALNNCEFSSSHLIPLETGYFVINWATSTEVAVANSVYQIGLSIDELPPDPKTILERKFGNTDIGALAGNATLHLTSGSAIMLQIQRIAGSGDITIKWANLTINSILTGVGESVPGADGTSGTSGVNGTSGTSGTSGATGTSGTSGVDGTSGTSGVNGTSGTSGVDGTSGTSGVSNDGTSGTSGTSGISGSSGTSGADGTSGTSGVNGTSGTSGADGTSGTSGTTGTSGTSGSSGNVGTGSFGTVFINSTALTAADTGSFITWQAVYPCTASAVKGYRVGGTNAQINVKKNASDLLASNLLTTNDNGWVSSSTLQNQNISINDNIYFNFAAVTGSVTQIGIQLEIFK